jgi:hypothetical protein
MLAPRGRGRLGWITFNPLLLYKVIELFRPKHTPKCLPHYLLQVIANRTKEQRTIKFICFFPALLYNIIKSTLVFEASVLIRRKWSQLQTDHGTSTSARDITEYIMCGRLGSTFVGAHKRRLLG